LIAITFDTEWSPIPVLTFAREIMDRHGTAATWFCTDDKAKRCLGAGHELAVHPCFKSVRTEAATLSRLLRLYPEARGSRSHSVYFHTRLTDLYKQFGIEYDCNYVIPARVKPWWLLNGILEIPVNYADNYMFLQNNWFPIEELDCWRNPMPVVFSFHPVHVYVNTESQEHYENVKQFYHDPEKLWIHRNNEVHGTEDYLLKLLEKIRQDDLETCTLGEINREQRKLVAQE
jgi:hypothetical protein